MDLLSGYGTDDSEKSQDIGPLVKRPKRESAQPPGQASARRYSGHLGKLERKSRWAKTSAFFAPVGYDVHDVADEDSDADDNVTVGVKTSSRNTRPLLMSMLPAPTHTVQNKNAPNIPEIPVYEQSKSTKEYMANQTRTIELAPNVGQGVPVPAAHVGTERPILPEGVSIKEISGASLRGHGTETIADTSGMRAALGDEYEMKLRSEAARVGNVSKMAKRKNQLSSLFVNAKAQEIEQMEKQASGVKTKTETQRKYGW